MARTKTRQRPPANQLVAKAMTLKIANRKSWLDLMAASHRVQIVEAAKQWPNTGRPWTCLAQVVKEQFKLEVSIRMIADGLKKASQQ